MNRIALRNPRETVRRTLALGASGVLLAASAALAAGAYNPAQAQARYQAERGECLGGQSSQDRATCLREAAAARAEARQGRLDSGNQAADFQRNATERCKPLPDDQRRDCVARMQGMGTTEGSVEAGGIYREMVTREIGVRPATPPATPEPSMQPAPATEPAPSLHPAPTSPAVPAETMPAPRTPAY